MGFIQERLSTTAILYTLLVLSIFNTSRLTIVSYMNFFITDDNCQYWKNLDEMTLTSPKYPKWYDSDSIGCEWLISAPEGFIIRLEFNHFHVSTLLDFVKNFLL